MALTKNQLLTQIGNAIDAAQAAPDRQALLVIQDANTKYKIRVTFGFEDRIEITRRPVT